MKLSLAPELRDFRNCLAITWQALGLPEPTRGQYELAYRLQHGPSHDVINCFRGVGKTVIVSAFAAWTHRWRLDDVGYCDDEILVLSQGKDFANQVADFMRQIIAVVPELACLKPRSGQRDAMDAFDVGPRRPGKDPSFKAAGIFGQITGARATLLIADDIETPNTAETVGQREKLDRRIAEFGSILKPGGRVKVPGTPHTEDSIYLRLVDSERGYSRWVMPARYPEEGAVVPGTAAFILEDLREGRAFPGDPVDPRRFSDEDLTRREAEVGRSAFRMQFALDTALADQDRFPLKLSDLVVMDLDDEVAPQKVAWARSPEQEWDIPNYGFRGDRLYRPFQLNLEGDRAKWLPYNGVSMRVDPSGRGKDETAWAVAGALAGYVFVLDVQGRQEGFSDATMQAIAASAKRWRVGTITVEANFGGGTFSKALLPFLRAAGVQCAVEEDTARQQKERKIADTLEPLLNQHRVVMNAQVLRDDAEGKRETSLRLTYQLSHLTRDRGSLTHDDRLEVVADVCGDLADQAALTAEGEMERRLEEIEAREQEDGLFGKPKTLAGPTWGSHMIP